MIQVKYIGYKSYSTVVINSENRPVNEQNLYKLSVFKGLQSLRLNSSRALYFAFRLLNYLKGFGKTSLKSI